MHDTLSSAFRPFQVAAFIAAILLFLPLSASAQGIGSARGATSNAPSFYFHVEPGSATVQVQLLGTVRSPGLYELTAGTTLGQLIALSGGPTLGATGRSIARTVVIHIHRGSREPSIVQTLRMGEPLPETDAHGIAMQDGDVVSVEVFERERIGWRDILSVASTIAWIALTVDRLATAF